jgi:hypothetical protein
VGLIITILYVDTESGIVAGFKEPHIPGVPHYVPEFERFMGRAYPINSTHVNLQFDESADSAVWLGVANLADGTLELQRVEGLEVLSNDGSVLDNQAASVFFMEKETVPFDVSAAAAKFVTLMAGASSSAILSSVALLLISSVISLGAY